MPRNPRLLFVAPSAYPLGGVATWLDYLLPGLAALGWRPTLGLVSGHWHDVGAYASVHPYPDLMAIDNPTGSAEGRVRALTETIRRTRPDIVLGVNIPDVYAAVARLRIRKRPAPKTVMTIHGIEPDYYEDAKRCRDVLDAVICTNRLACRIAVADAGIAEERVHYAPYGVTLPPAGEPKQPGRPLRIVYVGRMDQWQKRVHDLPSILEHLEGRGVVYRLMLAGGGPEETRLRETLAGRVAAGRVRFSGTLSAAQLVDQVYRQADVLLLTSFWETGPIVLWEAMAHGLAVVSSRYVGSGLEGSLMDNDNCLLFPIGDARAAADCLARLEDRESWLRLVNRSRDLILSRYTLARSVDAWDRCLRAITDQPGNDRDPAPPPVPVAGKLDRVLGTGLGETMRRLCRVRFRHNSPGGEWPHSKGVRALRDENFWHQARRLDTP